MWVNKTALLGGVIVLLSMLHQIFQKLFHIPIGFLATLIVFSIASYYFIKDQTYKKSTFIILLLGIIYAFFVILSIPIGFMSEGKPFDQDVFKLIFDYLDLGFDWRDLRFVLPLQIPPYEKQTQPFAGIYYTCQLPVLIFGWYLVIKNSKNEDKFLGSINSVLFVILFLNMIFNYIEYSIPSLHSFIMSSAGVGDGSDFFSYRGFSLAFHFYVNAFMLQLFYAIVLANVFIKKRVRDVIFVVLGLGAILISGTRVSWLGSFVVTIVTLLFVPLSANINRLSILIKSIIGGVIVFIIMIIIKPDTLDILMTIVNMKDTSGSSQIHAFYFLHSLDIIAQYPLGIGVGKSDFGAFGTSAWINTESHMLSLAMGTGLHTFLLFLFYYLILCKKAFKSSLKEVQWFYVFSFGVSVLFISFINMQYMESTVPISILSILLTIGLIKSEGKKIDVSER